ncbi:MAG TPA: choice-of-anchor tandem repeat GloVer-containing protein [Rhizomicrobium sp.]|nr:choice-of-anchor tandem repeat GloVer-containing protein [Rhizomicrobium sp.]
MTRVLSIALLAGTCVLALSAPTNAGSFTLLHKFRGGKDGMNPASALVADSQGNLYGTTESGGSKNCGIANGCGTVFRIAADGTMAILYAFTGGNDGWESDGVTFGPDGALYGTTWGGGTNICGDGWGCGTVYRLTTDGQKTILYNFAGGNDGAQPAGRVAFDKKGRLYGTTALGGAFGNGTVFAISPKGVETVLHAFGADGDGSTPAANVVLDRDGNLYGTTVSGGTNFSGTVFKLAADGTESVLHSFGSQNDGFTAYSDLLIDRKGNLYGTTENGGSSGLGTVFRLTPSGQETVLHSFSGRSGQTIDGANPDGGVIVGANGDLYGATKSGGVDNLGAVYSLAPDGNLTVLHSFRGGKDGSTPVATLGSDDLGTIYGTAYAGSVLKGSCSRVGCGTVFRISQ